jgi:cell division protein FtsW
VSAALGQPGRRQASGAGQSGGAAQASASKASPRLNDQRPGSLAGARIADLRLADARRAVRALLSRPLASYYLVLGCSLLLLIVGLMMVLSTSTAYALENGLPQYSLFAKQLIGAVVGLILMWLLAKSPARLFRACAYPLLLTSLVGLMAVLVVGVHVGGATRWLVVAGFQVQPSEFAKLALVVWGADLLARKEKLGLLTDWRQLLVPLLPGTAIICILVMLGDDLGTTFLMLVIFLALLWVVGAPGKLLAGMIGLLGFVMVMLIIVHPYELQRLAGFLAAHQSGCNSQGNCYQLAQGKIALGSGGLFGVGSGASKAKWGWVPNPYTDFIFSILGEELGLIGTLCVTILYGGLAYAGLRIARRVQDTFSQLAAGAITVWLITQAMVNIGAVIGVLPITGVPLPLISQGLSSLLVTMAALGMLMSFARSEPGARQALATAGPGVPRRLLGWLGLGRRPA